jgi:hypothetical protein
MTHQLLNFFKRKEEAKSKQEKCYYKSEKKRMNKKVESSMILKLFKKQSLLQTEKNR